MGLNGLPTPKEYAEYLRHRDAAREFYRQGKFEEGWQYVLDNQHAFPQQKLDEMFLAFSKKIFGLEK